MELRTHLGSQIMQQNFATIFNATLPQFWQKCVVLLYPQQQLIGLRLKMSEVGPTRLGF